MELNRKLVMTFKTTDEQEGVNKQLITQEKI